MKHVIVLFYNRQEQQQEIRQINNKSTQLNLNLLVCFILLFILQKLEFGNLFQIIFEGQQQICFFQIITLKDPNKIS